MRLAVWLSPCVAIGCACTVPDKQPLAGDVGGDAGIDAPDDGEPPSGDVETRITSAPGEFSSSGTAVFEFEASIADATFDCTVDGGAWTACSSPYARQLPDGPHSFAVRARAPASSASDASPAEHLWSIDTVAPITTLTNAPPSADNSATVEITFIANEMNVTFECALDGRAFTVCSSGDEVGPLSDGAHSFAVRARDRAGNVDASPAIHAWSVDTSTPDTQIVAGPQSASSSGSATFSFASSDAGSGATYQCSIDGAAFVGCSSPITYAGLDTGVHTFAVRVRDATGNVDPTPATRTWTIDLTPPQTTLTSGPSGTVTMASASFTFTASESDVTFACRLDDEAFAPCTSPFIAMQLAQGPHTFAVAATDVAGNTDPTPATASWTIDTSSPTLAITQGPDSGATTGPRVTFAWTADEGDVECRFDEEAAWMPCTSPLAFNAPAGPARFELRATDGAGNTSSLSRSWEVVCAAPDSSGAAGLLHLDDDAQTLANATGGASATLGLSPDPELQDPVFEPARFGDGLELDASQADLVTWPAGLGTTPAFTIELWARPEAVAGTRNILGTGDGRLALRVIATSPDTVRFTVTVTDDGGTAYTLSSAGDYPARQWHMLVLSVASPRVQLWVDGDREEIASAALGMPLSLDSFVLGGNLEGGLDEVWLATREVGTDADVLARYCPWLELRL